jgi:creatinine amidohydrolase
MKTYAAVLASAVILCSVALEGQIHRLAEQNAEQIRILPRDKTVIVIPAGILEEHGPYLPTYTDGFWDHEMAEEIAKGVVRRSGWHVLLFPDIVLGSAGAESLAGKSSYPGSYTIRPAVLRAIYMDLATQFGEQGFRWIIVVANHGAPVNSVALDQAADFFHDTYGGDMVHLYGLKQVRDCCSASIASQLTQQGRDENGLGLHAGAGEHSTMLYFQPQLVQDGYLQAPSMTAHDMDEVFKLAISPGWPGYIGAPRLASASAGGIAAKQAAEGLVKMVLNILDGMNYQALPRFASPGDASSQQDKDSPYAKAIAVQQEWLKRHDAKSIYVDGETKP